MGSFVGAVQLGPVVLPAAEPAGTSSVVVVLPAVTVSVPKLLLLLLLLLVVEVLVLRTAGGPQ
jgi:hypothetical protein